MKATNEQTAIEALAEYLGCSPDDLNEARHDHYGLTIFKHGSREYAVGTDSEADSAATEAIRDSAWAFRPSFLASFCDLPEVVFEAMQNKCEDSNDAILSLIEKTGGLAAFVQEAVFADGRGHFLTCCDGDENEHGGFYIYRIN